MLNVRRKVRLQQNLQKSKNEANKFLEQAIKHFERALDACKAELESNADSKASRILNNIHWAIANSSGDITNAIYHETDAKAIKATLDELVDHGQSETETEQN
jgi:hypothetical protein